MRKKSAGLLVCVLLAVLCVSVWKALRIDVGAVQSELSEIQHAHIEEDSIQGKELDRKEAGQILGDSESLWTEGCRSFLHKLLVWAVVLPFFITASLVTAMGLRQK